MPKRIIKGTITSDKMKDTVVVKVDLLKKHKFYKKPIKQSKNFKASNDLALEIGDVVMIEECRPLSKQVSWKVIKNLTKEEEK